MQHVCYKNQKRVSYTLNPHEKEKLEKLLHVKIYFQDR